MANELITHSRQVVWLYGLSGSGKSTIADGLYTKLLKEHPLVQRLDGDNLRKGINNNLGFSDLERLENIRRSAEVTKLFFEAHFICLCSFITPTKQTRVLVREIIGKNNLLEVYVKASLETCVQRDPKGLYKKVSKGEIKNFTGYDSSFQEPVNPDLIIDTEKLTIEQSIQLLYNHLR